MATVQELYIEYVKELDSRKGPGYFIGEGKPVTEIAVRMFNAVRFGGKCDWLAQNAALKAACKRVGILKSSQLRELLKAGVADGQFSPTG